MSDERLNLPFDLYTRNKIITDLINLLHRDRNSLKILDVGGRSGQIRDFFHKDDELYILDIRKSEKEEENYFIGNIINAPFINGIFDFVISSDLYEHISPENRLNSILEMLRISKNFVILGAPFYAREVAEADIQANEYFRKLTGVDHKWLPEHIKNGLPSKEELNDFLKKNGLDYLTVETNNISSWILMQFFIFYSDRYGIPRESIRKVHRFYNENFLDLGDSLKPTYRTIYLIGKKGILPESELKFNSVMNKTKYHSLEELIFETIGQLADSRDTYIQKLELAIKKKDMDYHSLELATQEKNKHIHNLEMTIGDSNRKLNEIHSSNTWQILTRFQRFIDIILPPSTKRRRAYDHGIVRIRRIISSKPNSKERFS